MSVIKEHIAKRIEQARDVYAKDLDALEEARLAQSLGGAARTPYDFTYEVVFVNWRIAKRLRGEEPEPYNPEGWITAPEDFKNRQVMRDALLSSANDVLDAWATVPEDRVSLEIETPGGRQTALQLASLCATHMVYHDAQLNYIQSLVGDDEMHWD